MQVWNNNEKSDDGEQMNKQFEANPFFHGA